MPTVRYAPPIAQKPWQRGGSNVRDDLLEFITNAGQQHQQDYLKQK